MSAVGAAASPAWLLRARERQGAAAPAALGRCRDGAAAAGLVCTLGGPSERPAPARRFWWGFLARQGSPASCLASRLRATTLSAGERPLRSQPPPCCPCLLSHCTAGERSNDDFFLHYGFVPPQNPHDDVALFTGVWAPRPGPPCPLDCGLGSAAVPLPAQRGSRGL